MKTPKFSGILVLAAGLLFGFPAGAHQVGVSAGFYELKASKLEAHLSIAQTELLRAFPKLDTDFDGELSTAEVSSSSTAFARSWTRGLRVFADEAECRTLFVSARKIDADGVLLDLEFKCEPAKQNYEIRANFIKRMFAGHRHLIRANLPGGLFAGTLVVARSQIRLSVDGHRAREGQGSRFLSLLAFGFEHILTGFDHLVFLLALILVCLRFKPLLILITAFTVGHSVTLSLAALDIWSPDSNLVELLIAATIIYVGIENLVTRNPKHRWYLTLLFGLVHGFGFASMLTARGLDPNQLVLDLVAFNFGVELGQICCLLLVVPILKGLRRAAWFDSWGFMGLNALIIMAGVYWFQDRLWNLWC